MSALRSALHFEVRQKEKSRRPTLDAASTTPFHCQNLGLQGLVYDDVSMIKLIFAIVVHNSR